MIGYSLVRAVSAAWSFNSCFLDRSEADRHEYGSPAAAAVADLIDHYIETELSRK